MNDAMLANTVKHFNLREYEQAVRFSAEGLATAEGRDEAFWMGLNEACEGYALLNQKQVGRAEAKLVGAMEKLRTFGFRYETFEVTAALAALRLAVEEIRAVRSGNKKVFDVSIVPQFRLAAKADD